MIIDRVIDKHNFKKHFVLEIANNGFDFYRRTKDIEVEATLDGICVIRISLDKNEITAEDTVRYYKK